MIPSPLEFIIRCILAVVIPLLVFNMITQSETSIESEERKSAITRRQNSSQIQHFPEECHQGLKSFSQHAPEEQEKIIKICRHVGIWGDVNTQYVLGNLYEAGIYVSQDIEEAEKWYKEAARQGHVVALYKMAQLGAGRAYKAYQSGDNSSVLEIIDAYAWFCVWDMQMAKKDSLGLEIWNDPQNDFKGKQEEFRNSMLKIVEELPFPARLSAKRLCRSYVDIYDETSDGRQPLLKE